MYMIVDFISKMIYFLLLVPDLFYMELEPIARL